MPIQQGMQQHWYVYKNDQRVRLSSVKLRELGIKEVTPTANPSIVICHVSGFGQDGDPEYVGRASYDFTAQAFGGMMNLMGNPDPDPPSRAVPWTADYITALFCLWSSLAAYIHAQKTGQGQVIDLAQYEAVHRILAGTMVAYHELGMVRERAARYNLTMLPSLMAGIDHSAMTKGETRSRWPGWPTPMRTR